MNGALDRMSKLISDRIISNFYVYLFRVMKIVFISIIIIALIKMDRVYNNIHLRLIYFRMSSNSDRFRISSALFRNLKELGLLKKCFIRPRGRRAGIRARVKCDKIARGVNRNNLIYVVPDKPKSCVNLINIGCINAQSLRNKADLFKDSILECDLDICMITETWFKEGDAVKRIDCKPIGYNLNDTIRPIKMGGGTALLTRNFIKVQVLRTGEFHTFEFSEYKIKISTVFFIVLIIYRPPGSSFTLFLDDFSELIEPILNTTHRLLICGDFNIHVNKTNCPENIRFQDFLISRNLKNFVNFETHMSGNTLDLVIMREDENVPISITQGSFISDHCLINFKVDITRPTPIHKKINYRKIKDIDLEIFRQDILGLQLFSQNRNQYSIDDLCLSFDRSLSELLDLYASIITETARNGSFSLWYNDDLHKLKHEKRRSEDKLRRHKNSTDLHTFKIVA